MRVIGSKLRRRSKVSSLFEQLETRELLSNTLMVGPGQMYTTIQAAVNAATLGTTILVAPGTYTEQVTIPAGLTALTIQAQNLQPSTSTVNVPPNSSVTAVNALFPNAANSSIILAPASTTGNMAIIDDSASSFHLTGFVIEGPSQGLNYGVLVEGGATAVQVDHNHILHVHDVPLSGGQSGYAVAVAGGSSATISQDFISDYQKSGIVIDGATSVGTVSNDVVVGAGSTPLLTQNGIFFDNGASGSISSSLVTANVYTGPLSAAGTGILLLNSGQVSITSNVIYSDDENIVLDGPSNTAATSLTDYAHGSMVAGNETYDATFDGIDLFDGANSVTISNNNSHNNGFDGLLIDSSSDGNLVTNNQFAQNNQSNVSEFDIEDLTLGMVNPVVGNFGTGNFYSLPDLSIATNFTLPPSVISVTPFTGPVAGGTVVTINGSHFTGATGVNFGGVPVASFMVNAAGTQVTATAPAEAAGTVDVTVVTPLGGTSAIMSADKFTYVALGPVTVTSVVINGNNAALAGVQRSAVNSIVYTFNEAVTLAATNAFTFAVHTGQTGTAPTLTWTAINPDGNGASTQWVVTFSGAGVTPTGSIADGVYDITLNTAAVTSEANPTATTTPRVTDTFYRLYGDALGNAASGQKISNTDYNMFLSTFGLKSGVTGYLACFNEDGNTKIDNTDYNIFLSNFGKKLSGFTATI